MNDKSTTSKNCPSCGQPAEGSFCSHCGASLTGSKQWNAQSIAPWAAIGISMIALVVAISAHVDEEQPVSHGLGNMPNSLGSASPQASPFALPLGSSVPAAGQSGNQVAGQPPDLSALTPREMADRLFNRIMTASENGNFKEALVFVPMGVQAYNNLGPLDNDARYHLALIHLVASDIKNARKQIEKLRQSAPKHLLAYMLEYQIAGLSGNKKSATHAYKNFLSAYETEFLMDRGEYRDHQGSIDSFRKAAQASVAGKK